MFFDSSSLLLLNGRAAMILSAVASSMPGSFIRSSLDAELMSVLCEADLLELLWCVVVDVVLAAGAVVAGAVVSAARATVATNAMATTADSTAGMRFILNPPDRGIVIVEHLPSNGHSTWGHGPPYSGNWGTSGRRTPGAGRGRPTGPSAGQTASPGARAGRGRGWAARGAAGRGAGRGTPGSW